MRSKRKGGWWVGRERYIDEFVKILIQMLKSYLSFILKDTNQSNICIKSFWNFGRKNMIKSYTSFSNAHFLKILKHIHILKEVFFKG